MVGLKLNHVSKRGPRELAEHDLKLISPGEAQDEYII